MPVLCMHKYTLDTIQAYMHILYYARHNSSLMYLAGKSSPAYGGREGGREERERGEGEGGERERGEGERGGRGGREGSCLIVPYLNIERNSFCLGSSSS